MGGLSELKCLQKSNFRMRMLKPSICDNKNVDESPPPDPHGGRLRHDAPPASAGDAAATLPRRRCRCPKEGEGRGGVGEERVGRGGLSGRDEVREKNLWRKRGILACEPFKRRACKNLFSHAAS